MNGIVSKILPPPKKKKPTIFLSCGGNLKEMSAHVYSAVWCECCPLFSLTDLRILNPWLAQNNPMFWFGLLLHLNASHLSRLEVVRTRRRCNSCSVALFIFGSLPLLRFPTRFSSKSDWLIWSKACFQKSLHAEVRVYERRMNEWQVWPSPGLCPGMSHMAHTLATQKASRHTLLTHYRVCVWESERAQGQIWGA